MAMRTRRWRCLSCCGIALMRHHDGSVTLRKTCMAFARPFFALLCFGSIAGYGVAYMKRLEDGMVHC